MKIQQFTGGLSNRLRPQYLNINQAIVYENIDNTRGTLLPVKTNRDTGRRDLQKYSYFYEAGQEFLSFATRRQFVEYQEVLYISNENGIPQRYDGTLNRLGVLPPAAAPGIAGQFSPPDVIGTETAITSPVPGALPSTELEYLLVNSDTPASGETIQSIAYSLSIDENGLPAFKVKSFQNAIFSKGVSGVPGADRTVTFQNVNTYNNGFGNNGVEIYRLYNGIYRLAGSVANPAATFTDSVEDISSNQIFDESRYGNIRGFIQYAYTYYNSVNDVESELSPLTVEINAENGIKPDITVVASTDPQVDKIKIYRIGGDLTQFTLVDTINNTSGVYEDKFLDIDIAGNLYDSDRGAPPNNITNFAEAYAILFGSVGPRLYFSEIGKPQYWIATNFLDFDTEITGIAPVANGLLVFTKLKTHLLTGTSASSFSQQVLSADQGSISKYSVRLIDDIAIWVSTDGLCVSGGADIKVISQEALGKLELKPDNSIIYDQVYYLVETDGSILTFDFKFGQIYRDLNVGVQSLTKGNDVLYGWGNGAFFEMFAGNDFQTMKYVSPRFIDGSATNHKSYKKFYIYSKGQISLKLYVDDRLVQEASFSTEDSHVVQIPVAEQRGFFIQVEIEGTGEVYEYEYLAELQKNV